MTCTNLGGKNLADIVAIFGQGRELFRPPTYFYRCWENTVIVLNDMFSCGVIIAIWKKVDNSILTTSGIFVGKILWGNLIQYLI
jgi:hypothetical protein